MSIPDECDPLNPASADSAPDDSRRVTPYGVGDEVVRIRGAWHQRGDRGTVVEILAGGSLKIHWHTFRHLLTGRRSEYTWVKPTQIALVDHPLPPSAHPDDSPPFEGVFSHADTTERRSLSHAA